MAGATSSCFVFLSFFLLLANFFHAQGILSAAWMLATVIVLLAALLSAQYGTLQPRLAQRLGLLGRMLALALPLAAVMFLAVPRVDGPLWGAARGRAGAHGLVRQHAAGRHRLAGPIKRTRLHGPLFHAAPAARPAVLARRGAGRLRRRHLDAPGRWPRTPASDSRIDIALEGPAQPLRSDLASERPAAHLRARRAAQHRTPARQSVCRVVRAGSADHTAHYFDRALPRQFPAPLPAAGRPVARAATAMAGLARWQQPAQRGLGPRTARQRRAGAGARRRHRRRARRISATRPSATPCSHRCWASMASTTSCLPRRRAFASITRAASSC